jgi:hypothetical protein
MPRKEIIVSLAKQLLCQNSANLLICLETKYLQQRRLVAFPIAGYDFVKASDARARFDHRNLAYRFLNRYLQQLLGCKAA